VQLKQSLEDIRHTSDVKVQHLEKKLDEANKSREKAELEKNITTVELRGEWSTTLAHEKEKFIEMKNQLQTSFEQQLKSTRSSYEAEVSLFCIIYSPKCRFKT
jgi:hypothetical protein